LSFSVDLVANDYDQVQRDEQRAVPGFLEVSIMKKIFLMACAAAIFASMSVASADQQNEWGYTGDDYTGPFTTQTLYTMCSQKKTRDKCLAYIQGLEYGIAISKSMAEKSPSLRFCPPRMTPEEARVRILQFIDGATKGKPSNNKDAGDWMAYMGIVAGNICK
jgi:hypothetical protein